MIPHSDARREQFSQTHHTRVLIHPDKIRTAVQSVPDTT